MNTTIMTVDVDGSWLREGSFGMKVLRIPKRDPALVDGIPNMLEVFRRFGISGTFFVVGKNVEKFPVEHRQILEQDNEIANHSYSHPVQFPSLNYSKKLLEVERNEQIVRKTLKLKMYGFRSPRNYIDSELIDILEKKKYVYDSSVLPIYYPGFFKFSDLFNIREPYHPGNSYKKRGAKKIWEIPISSVGPFSLNGTVLHNLGINYLRIFSKIVFSEKRPLVLHFHTRDLANVPRKAIFLRPLKRRQRVINQTINYLKKRSKFLTLLEYCESLQ